MTISNFDPVCLGQYHFSARPAMLHFQWEGSEDIYRYVLAEKISVSEINSETRRKKGEGIDAEPIAKSYLKEGI